MKKVNPIVKSAIIFGVIIIPLLYSLFYLGAFWDPYARMSDVPVAVVNEDKGGTVNGEQRNIGSEVSKQLKEDGSVKFIFTNKNDADAGVFGRKYYAAIYIPENFTANVGTVSKNTAKLHSTITYKANQKKNYLAAQIVGTALPTIKDSVNSAIDEQIVETLSGKLQSVPSQMKPLQDGLATIQSGTQQISDGNSSLYAGTKKLNASVPTLASGVNALNTGAAKLSSGAKALANGTNRLNSNVPALASGVKRLNSGASQLSTGANSLSNGTNQLNSKIPAITNGVSAINNGASQLSAGAQQLAAGTSQLNSQVPSLATGVSQLSTGAKQLSTGIAQYTQGASQLNTGAKQLYAGITQAGSQLSSDKLAALHTARQAADNAVKNGIDITPSNAITLNAGGIDISVSKVNLSTDGKGIVAKLNASAYGMDFTLTATVSGSGTTITSDNTMVNYVLSGLDDSTKQQTVSDFTTKLLADSNSQRTLQTALSSIPTLISQVDSLDDGLSTLSTQLNKTTDSSGNATILGGAKQVSDGLAQLNSNNDTLTGGASQLSSGLDTLNSSVPALTNGVSSINDGAQQISTNMQTLAAGASQLNDGMPALASGVNQINGGASQVASGAAKLANGTKSLNAAVPTLTNGVNALNSGASQVSNGAKQLANGTSQLNSNVPALSNGVSALNSGAKRLASGSNQLNSGVKSAQSQVNDALDSTNSQLKSLDGLSEYSKSPVNTETKYVQPVANYGSAFAPYFMGLSLWVGGLMIYFGLYLDYHRKIKILTMDSERPVVRNLAFGAISAVQGIALAFVVQVILGIKINNPLLLYLSCIAVSITFMMIIQFCIIYLGDVGKFLALLLLILQLTSCAGTFPIETQSQFYVVINKFLPMTYSTQLFKEAISGTAGSYAAQNFGIILAYFAGITVLTIVARLIQKANQARKAAAQAVDGATDAK